MNKKYITQEDYDDDMEALKANIKGYVGHNTPSKETIKNLNKIEKKMDELQNKVNDMDKKVATLDVNFENLKENNTKEHKDLKDIIEKFIASADTRYAPKWIKELVWSLLLGVSGLIVVTAWDKLIN